MSAGGSRKPPPEAFYAAYLLIGLALLLAGTRQLWLPEVPARPVVTLPPPFRFQPQDLNRASAGLLAGTPGIGPALAARIVAWRRAHGPFASCAAVGEVPGIGPAKREAICRRFAVLRDGMDAMDAMDERDGMDGDTPRP